MNKDWKEELSKILDRIDGDGCGGLIYGCGELDTFYNGNKEKIINDINTAVQNTIMPMAEEAEHELCKKVYIDGADWSEWGISDEEAGEMFEEEYKEIRGEQL